MTTRLRRAGVVLIVSAVLGLAAALLLPSAVAARGGLVQVAVNGEAFTATPTGPLIDVAGLTPGTSATADFGVRSRLDSVSELVLRFVSVHDDDNGCTTPEALVDHSCGTGGGDLGAAIRMTIDAADTASGPMVRMWSGTAAQLKSGVDTKVSLPAAADRWVRITASLPASVGNEVQTDTFGFLARIELTTASGVAGVTVDRPGTPRSGGTGLLALTGLPLLLLMTSGVLMTIGGVVLIATALLSGRRRDRVNPSR